MCPRFGCKVWAAQERSVPSWPSTWQGQTIDFTEDNQLCKHQVTKNTMSIHFSWLYIKWSPFLMVNMYIRIYIYYNIYIIYITISSCWFTQLIPQPCRMPGPLAAPGLWRSVWRPFARPDDDLGPAFFSPVFKNVYLSGVNYPHMVYFKQIIVNT